MNSITYVCGWATHILLMYIFVVSLKTLLNFANVLSLIVCCSEDMAFQEKNTFSHSKTLITDIEIWTKTFKQSECYVSC